MFRTKILHIKLFFNITSFLSACPRRKYGIDCMSDCATCYNGGICEETSGVCVCPPGFQGDHCEIGRLLHLLTLFVLLISIIMITVVKINYGLIHCNIIIIITDGKLKYSSNNAIMF